jgi:hypothetical protein
MRKDAPVNVTQNKRCDAEMCGTLAENQCDDCKRWYCHAHSVYNPERKAYLGRICCFQESRYTFIASIALVIIVFLIVYIIASRIY